MILKFSLKLEKNKYEFKKLPFEIRRNSFKIMGKFQMKLEIVWINFKNVRLVKNKTLENHNFTYEIRIPFVRNVNFFIGNSYINSYFHLKFLKFLNGIENSQNYN